MPPPETPWVRYRKRIALDIKKDLALRGLLEDVERICRENHSTVVDAVSRTRSLTAHRARLHCWLFMANIGMSGSEIARIWGRDHTSILAGLKKLRGMNRP